MRESGLKKQNNYEPISTIFIEQELYLYSHFPGYILRNIFLCNCGKSPNLHFFNYRRDHPVYFADVSKKTHQEALKSQIKNRVIILRRITVAPEIIHQTGIIWTRL